MSPPAGSRPRPAMAMPPSMSPPCASCLPSMTEARLSIARTLVIGTRGSALARWQTEWASAALTRAWPQLTIVLLPVTTSGDRQLEQPLPAIGGKGVFTEDLENALRAGEIDLAVHSLKDLP